MKKILELSLLPNEANDKIIIDEKVGHQKYLGKINGYRIHKKSVDARRSPIKVNLQIEIFIDEEIPSLRFIPCQFKDADEKKQVLIIGAGPAGLFTA